MDHLPQYHIGTSSNHQSFLQFSPPAYPTKTNCGLQLTDSKPFKRVHFKQKKLHYEPILHTHTHIFFFFLCTPTFTPSTLFPKTKKSPSIFFSGSVRHWKAFESFLKALDKTSLHETTPWLPQHTNEVFVLFVARTKQRIGLFILKGGLFMKPGEFQCIIIMHDHGLDRLGKRWTLRLLKSFMCSQTFQFVESQRSTFYITYQVHDDA